MNRTRIPALLASLLLAAPAHADLPAWRSAFGDAEQAARAQLFDRAKAHYQEAVELAEEILGESRPGASWLGTGPGVPVYGPLWASLRGLSGLHEVRGDLDEAVRVEHRIDHLLDELELPGGWERYRSQARLSALLEKAGDWEGVATMAGVAVRFLEARLETRDPIEPLELWVLRIRLGEALRRTEQPEGARRVLGRALETMNTDLVPFVGYEALRRKLLALTGDEAPESTLEERLFARAREYERLHDLDNAAKAYSSAADRMKGLSRARALEALAALGRTCQGCALPAPLPLLEEARRIRAREQGETHPDTLGVLETIAHHVARKDPKKLRSALEQIVAVKRKALGEAHSSVGETRLSLAEQARYTGDIPAAVRFGEEAIESFRGADDVTGTERAFFQLSLTYQGLRRHAELAALYRRKLEWLRATYGPRHLKVGWRLMSLAEAEASGARWDEALTAARQARDILRETGPEHGLENALGLIARIQRERGESGAARVAEAARRAWAVNRDPLHGAL